MPLYSNQTNIIEGWVIVDAVGWVNATYLLCEGVGTIVLWDGGGSWLCKKRLCSTSKLQGDCGKRYVSVLCVCLVGCSVERNEFGVLRRCCLISVWLRFLFLEGYVGK